MVSLLLCVVLLHIALSEGACPKQILRLQCCILQTSTIKKVWWFGSMHAPITLSGCRTCVPTDVAIMCPHGFLSCIAASSCSQTLHIKKSCGADLGLCLEFKHNRYRNSTANIFQWFRNTFFNGEIVYYMSFNSSVTNIVVIRLYASGRIFEFVPKMLS